MKGEFFDENKKSFTKKIISLLLLIIIIIGNIPASVQAATYNGNEVEPVVDGEFDYGLPTNNAKVIGYMTPNAGELKIKSSDDDTIVIELNMEDGWSFIGWQTYYEGPSTEAENLKWDDNYYFSVEGDIGTPIGYSNSTKTANTIQINKEYGAGGALGCTYYVYAICNPNIEFVADRSIIFNFGTNEFSLPKFTTSVNYNANTSMTVKPPEKYIISSVSVNGKSSSYMPTTSDTVVKSEPEEYKVDLNNVKGPVEVTISTKLKEQKVKFDANGGTGTMSEQIFKSGEEQKLSVNAFTKEKYAFTGWNTKADNTGTTYTDSQLVIFNPENDGDSITLYAQWELLPQATYTAPTANDLEYTGYQQELVNGGTSEEGTLMYSLEKDGEYSETIPTAINAGKYTVWYYVKGDDNHNDSEKASVQVEIKKANPQIGTVSAKDVNDTTDISAVVLERTDETTEGSLIVKEGQTLNLGDNEIEYTFTPKDTSNYNALEGTVNVTVKDTIAPVGIVTLTDAEAVWDRIPETITFEMYFKDDQKAIVEATDSFSGVNKVEYYETNEVLDLEGIKLLSDDKWKVLDEDVVTIAEDAKQFIYYIRITDKSGNIAYLATNGAEFDTTAPVISGVVDGKTYYTSQEVTVTDKNLEKVKLNGEEVTDVIILEGNKEATYTIEAIDKVGNTTTITLKMAIKEVEETNDDESKKNKEENKGNKIEEKENSKEESLATGDNIFVYVFILIVSILIIIVIGKKALLKKGKYML